MGNVETTKMTTEKLIETTRIKSSTFPTNDDDLTTISDVSAKPKRQKHPMTLANISVDNVVHGDRNSAQYSRNELIIIIVVGVASLIIAMLFVVLYWQRHYKTNVLKTCKTCLKRTKEEVSYIRIPRVLHGRKDSDGTIYSNVSKQEITFNKISSSAPV